MKSKLEKFLETNTAIAKTGKPVGLIIPIVFFSQTWEGFKAIQVLKSKS
ncbi:hypothetical protein [Dendronalium sp. ChiSLP03b]|nr:hypothetical protein [Dendronalium sp. ChiSLP03b]MDZ8203066.1 hypothetical protein [Dendronalium sp. ChiSLP03b]